MARQIKEFAASPVVTLEQGATLFEAARLMRDRNIGDVIITEKREGKDFPIGILTDRDLAVKGCAESLDFKQTSVGDLMSPDLLTLRENEGVKESLDELHKWNVRRAPVCDQDGFLTGIISAHDLHKYEYAEE